MMFVKFVERVLQQTIVVLYVRGQLGFNLGYLYLTSCTVPCLQTIVEILLKLVIYHGGEERQTTGEMLLKNLTNLSPTLD